MKVHIAQRLPPGRHAIAAIACKQPEFASKSAVARLRATVDRLIATKAIDSWCVICNSQELDYEDGLTRFESLEEAEPHVRRAMELKLLTRKFLLDRRN